MKDRVGLGWRAQLAAGIFDNLERIDVVEVIADDYFDATAAQSRSLRTLSSQVPVVVHGVSLGAASVSAVEQKRLDRLARVVASAEPESWSEHLAFVRAGGYEIGHLAAPPRTEETVEGTAQNLARASRAVGSDPLVENIATLVDPPCSTFDEPTWINHILAQGEWNLLLDLHNLYANAVNFGASPFEFLRQIPADRIGAVHIAGGRWIDASTPQKHAGRRRLLDDHLHEVPPPVYELLSEVARNAPGPLTVILERDGEFPAIEELLAELDRARAAIAVGRARAGPREAEHECTV